MEFVKVVICSNDDELFQYIINWVAKMIQGKKNDTMLVFVSATEGAGKSSFTDLLLELMGSKNSCRPTPKQIIDFNYMTMGKYFVNIEETGDKADFNQFVQKIKGMITDSRYTYEAKHKDAIEAP